MSVVKRSTQYMIPTCMYNCNITLFQEKTLLGRLRIIYVRPYNKQLNLYFNL